MITQLFALTGGMKILFPNTLKRIALAGENLHIQLAEEIRGAIKSYADGKVTVEAIEQMPLMKSVVYESLRIDPPAVADPGFYFNGVYFRVGSRSGRVKVRFELDLKKKVRKMSLSRIEPMTSWWKKGRFTTTPAFFLFL
ncbi:putative hydroperoxide dehydratase [Helianthus annuus]|nr:putative hydroperoxide dehydratase [Helianthus annuus]